MVPYIVGFGLSRPIERTNERWNEPLQNDGDDYYYCSRSFSVAVLVFSTRLGLKSHLGDNARTTMLGRSIDRSKAVVHGTERARTPFVDCVQVIISRLVTDTIIYFVCMFMFVCVRVFCGMCCCNAAELIRLSVMV